jgi:hypothetical protein
MEERLLAAGRAVDQKEMLLQQSSRALQERLATQERASAALTQQLAAFEKTIGELIAERDGLLRRVDEAERTPAARLQALLSRGRKGRRHDGP